MKISLRKWAVDEGLIADRFLDKANKLGEAEKEVIFDRLTEISMDGIAPALCEDGCEVEPDGRCPHGCPSVLIATGVI